MSVVDAIKRMDNEIGFNNEKEETKMKKETVAIVSRGSHTLIKMNGAIDHTKMVRSVIHNNLLMCHMEAMYYAIGIMAKQEYPVAISILGTDIIENMITFSDEFNKTDVLNYWINDSKKDDAWKDVCNRLLNSIKEIEEKGGLVIINTGKHEKLFKEAWNELNKVVPKKPKVQYSRPYNVGKAF